MVECDAVVADAAAVADAVDTVVLVAVVVVAVAVATPLKCCGWTAGVAADVAVAVVEA